jgi:hypothetical protein
LRAGLSVSGASLSVAWVSMLKATKERAGIYAAPWLNKTRQNFCFFAALT